MKSKRLDTHWSKVSTQNLSQCSKIRKYRVQRFCRYQSTRTMAGAVSHDGVGVLFLGCKLFCKTVQISLQMFDLTTCAHMQKLETKIRKLDSQTCYKGRQFSEIVILTNVDKPMNAQRNLFFFSLTFLFSLCFNSFFCCAVKNLPSIIKLQMHSTKANLGFCSHFQFRIQFGTSENICTQPLQACHRLF